MRRAKNTRAKSRRYSRRWIVRLPSSTPRRWRRSIRPAALASRATNGMRRTQWRNGRTLRRCARAAAGLRKAFDPGPAFVSYGAYEMGPDGLHVEVEKGRGENKTKASEWVAAPFEILGACRDPHGRGWGKYLRWRDGDGRAHVQHVTDAALQGDPSTLCASLVDGGLRINRAQQRAFANYLSGVRVMGRVTIISAHRLA